MIESSILIYMFIFITIIRIYIIRNIFNIFVFKRINRNNITTAISLNGDPSHVSSVSTVNAEVAVEHIMFFFEMKWAGQTIVCRRHLPESAKMNPKSRH